jgi:hypothetical protein
MCSKLHLQQMGLSCLLTPFDFRVPTIGYKSIHVVLRDRQRALRLQVGGDGSLSHVFRGSRKNPQLRNGQPAGQESFGP